MKNSIKYPEYERLVARRQRVGSELRLSGKVKGGGPYQSSPASHIGSFPNFWKYGCAIWAAFGMAA